MSVQDSNIVKKIGDSDRRTEKHPEGKNRTADKFPRGSWHQLCTCNSMAMTSQHFSLELASHLKQMRSSLRFTFLFDVAWLSTGTKAWACTSPRPLPLPGLPWPFCTASRREGSKTATSNISCKHPGPAASGIP